MKILILTPDLPYPTASGAAIRNYGIIRSLAHLGHEITLLSFVQDDPDPQNNPLYQLCATVKTIEIPHRSKQERIISLISSPKADIELRLKSPAFTTALINILQANSFDLIQFSGIELGSYFDVLQSHKKSAKIFYDALNAEADLQYAIFQIDRQNPRRLPAAIYSYLQTRRIRGFERKLCQQVDCVIAVSDEDYLLLKEYQGAPIFHVSNGIFVDDYAPSADYPERANNQLVYTGKMDYRPNVDAIDWFASEILPQIEKTFPDIQLTIVGRNPHARIQPLTEKPNIHITGWVDSVQPFLYSATVFIVPLRMGSGTRLKILEAMASGCALVSTSTGAAGLNDTVKQAMIIADDAPTFAQAVITLLNNPGKRQKMGQDAITSIRQSYDWSALIPKLIRAYKEIGLG